MTKWPIAQLGDIATIQSGGTPSRSVREYWDGDIPWIKISDLTSTYVTASEERITTPGLENSSAKVFPKGTILLTIFATIGKVAILDIAAATNQAIAGITPRSNSYGKFLYYALVHYSNDLLVQGKGVAQKNINLSILKKLHLPLPTISEQKLIAAKLDKLFDHLNRIRERLDKIPALLKQFRQAVLTQAVTGKLTEEWRRNAVIKETGAQLLERIEREITSDQSKLPRGYKAKNKYWIDPHLYQLPPSWGLSVIDRIGVVHIGGTPSRSEPRYWNGDIKWVSSGEVNNSRIVDTKESITQLGLDNSSTKLLPKGTVLIAMIGEGKTRGQSAILEIQACTNQNIAAIVTHPKHFSSEFLWYFLLSSYERNRSKGQGANQPALNGEKVGTINIPIPPLQEQHEIVRRIGGLLAIADQIEARYETMKQKVERLPQAILNKAFRGELVKGAVKEYKRQLNEIEGMLAADS